MRDTLNFEKLFIDGDFNDLIGSASSSFDSVHEGFDFGLFLSIGVGTFGVSLCRCPKQQSHCSSR